MTKEEAEANGGDVSNWPRPWWETNPAAFAEAKAKAERSREAASAVAAPVAPIARADPWAKVIADLNARPQFN